MFTGIIEELGKVKRIQKKGRIVRLDVSAGKVCEGTKAGDSICVNGACLTVVDNKDKSLVFEVIPETLQNTTLGRLRLQEYVNLERALKVGERLGGHFVSGHVDCIGAVRSRKISRGDLEFQISIPAKFIKWAVHKGSVAVDGISLTIADVKGNIFGVCIIPRTAQMTTLKKAKAGDQVNVELDMLAKRPRLDIPPL